MRNKSELNAEKLIKLLDEFKNNSILLRSITIDKHLDEFIYGVKIFDYVLEILKEIKESKFELLGIRDFETKCKEGYSYNFTNGLMSIAQIGSCINEGGFYLTLNKNSNNANKNSIINFCMNDNQRKNIIDCLKIKLEKFDEIIVDKYGEYELRIIIRNKKAGIKYNNLKLIVDIIVEDLIKGNESGSENEYLKCINNLLVKNL